jgi:serine/threonine protein kinase/WD40 repeat protein
MPISITCSTCGSKFASPESGPDATAKCPTCGNSLSTRWASGPLSDSGAQTGAMSDAPAAAPAPLLDTAILPPQLMPEATAGSPPTAATVDAPAVPAAGRELVSFLAPPQGAGELGRLGAYRVIRVLGAGGMGVVLEGEDPRLQRRVALKVMKPSLAVSDAARQRFLREARAAAAIDHDHIVHIYQVDEDHGLPYLAMQLLKGETLEERILRDKKLSVAETLRIGCEIAAGLAAAHDRGLIHRDIKPANIWLESAATNPQGRVKIVDFGLARAAGQGPELTQHGAILGTPAYMAPEQVDGGHLDGRCDLFSLGCVLYRACTGAAPFKGVDTISTLMAVATHQPAPPRERNPEIPLALSDLIMQLLAKRPSDRPPDAHAVIRSLQAITPGQQSSGPITPSGPWQSNRGRQPLGGGRNRWALGAAGLLLVVVVLVSAFLVRTAVAPGRLLIDAGDPDVEIVIKQRGQAVVSPSKRRLLELKPGHYDIELAGAPAGTHLSQEKVQIVSGGAATIQILSEEERDSLEPSVLDELDPAQIPPASRLARQPRELVAVLVHGTPVRAVAFSADGLRMASAGDDKTVWLWQSATGTRLGPLPTSVSAIQSLAFAPDSQSLAMGMADGTVKLWGLASEKATSITGRPALFPVTCLAWAPDGRQLTWGGGQVGRLTSGRGWVKSWDVGNQNELDLHSRNSLSPVTSVAWTPDGKTLASGGTDGAIHLWKMIAGAESGLFKGHKGSVTGLAFSRDGHNLASASQDGTIRLWQWATQKKPTTILAGHAKKGITSVVYAQGGKLVFGADVAGHVIGWHAAAGTKASEWTLPGPVTALARAADERHLAAACENGSIYVFRVAEARESSTR